MPHKPKPDDQDKTVCGNTKCKYNNKGRCELFPGISWKRCRKAIIKPASSKQKESNNG